MEQGFSDACVALCMEQQPVARVAQSCRAAAIEMPRPTVRRWCEHGYNVAFQKTLNDLRTHFSPLVVESAQEEEVRRLDNNVNNAPSNGGIQQEGIPSVYNAQDNSGHHQAKAAEANDRVVLATIPVTLENDEVRNLLVYEGQDAEEAVVEFCRENLPSEVATCIRHLLDLVVEKLAESSNGSNN